MQQNDCEESRLAKIKKNMIEILIKRQVDKNLYSNMYNVSQLDEKSIEPDVYQFLRTLNISESNISCIPKDLGILPQLEELNLSKNNLGANEDHDWSWLEQTAIKTKLLVLNLSENSVSYIIQLIS